MISAKEARALSNKFDAEINLKHVEEHVLAHAANGGKSTQIDLIRYSNLGDNVSLVMRKLKKLGYQVKHDSGYDPRDQIGWNYLNISW